MNLTTSSLKAQIQNAVLARTMSMAALLVAAGVPAQAATPGSSHWTAPCNVVWTTPSRDAAGSMPLGNGEVGVNLWVEENGDLLFLISRSDSLSEVSRLLKVGRVRVALDPNPFRAGAFFRQELLLRDGICQIAAGEGTARVNLQVFVDSEYPVVHCVGEAGRPVSVRATVECWRTERRALAGGEEQNSAWTLHGAPFPLCEAADVFPKLPAGDAVAWYHRNEESVAVPSTLKVQSLESAASLVPDPLLRRTFGGWLAGSGFRAVSTNRLETVRPARSIALRVAVPCAQTDTADQWLAQAKGIAGKTDNPRRAQRRTAGWWQSFWERSWVMVSGERNSELPGAGHPLRIGYDSLGQNKFPGQIGRFGVYGLSLSSEDIARLASGEPQAPAVLTNGLMVGGNGTPREIASSRFSLTNGFSLEAWIKADRAVPGRILDKVTAGGSDGFLLDIHPGDTLRLIVGNVTLSGPAGILKTGGWHHAAATVGGDGALRLYLDGKVVANRGGESGSAITRSYVLQRYVQGCGGRGTYPIKFNGGIFTVEPKAMGKPFNPDFRAWGDCYWWQNVRHMYHPMLASGDFEMMAPLFRMYESARPLAEARTRIYHGAQGSYYPETMTVWGTYANGDYGWNRAGHAPKDVLCPYWQYAWNQGPEIVALMLDRWDYRGDEAFLKTSLLPMAESVLKYFDTRFSKDAEGKIILAPSQAVETFWHGVTNDTPTVAGLREITARLGALPERLVTPEQRAFFKRMRGACPELPIEEVNDSGKIVRTLGPAWRYAKERSNCENPELYAIWPFRLFGVGKPDLGVARAAYARRANHLDVGWGYDGNCAASLGLASEAGRILKVKCANSHPAYRWPATWGPNFDWLPDQNHGGNLLETTQLMLLQPVEGKIYLLPAWPAQWDVSFKLHAPGGTVVECIYRSGKIEKLEVTPKARRADVVFPEGLR